MLKHIKKYDLFESLNINYLNYKISDGAVSFLQYIIESSNFISNKIGIQEYVNIQNALGDIYTLSYSRIDRDSLGKSITYKKISIIDIYIEFNTLIGFILKDKDDYYYILFDYGPVYKFDQLGELLNNIEEVLKIELV